MNQQYKRFVNIIAIIVLLAVQAVLFTMFWNRYFLPATYNFNGFKGKGNIAIVGIYILVMYFFTRNLSGYKVGMLKITEICLSQMLAIICTNVVEYAELCIVLRAWVPAQFMILMTLIEIIIAVVWSVCFRNIYTSLYPAHKMIFVYGDRVQSELIAKINSRGDKYDIKASISINEGMEKIYETIEQYESVIIGDIPSSVRNKIAKYCYAIGKRAYLTPKISDIIVIGAEEINLFDTPLLLCKNFGLSGEQLFLKRIMDIVISCVLLLILSPFMLVTALCIKLYDGGPVFYKQERLTRDRRPFWILKFRSMRVDSEKAGARLAAKDDDRVTPIGRFIRRIHFDEIPQLLNILKGDMAFVGPRPEREVIARQYEEKIPEFAFRLKVKAGLTGYAQVFGKYNTTPYDKLKLDLTYIEKYSILLDIKIILMTLRVLFIKENSEGIASDQTTALRKD